MSYYDDSVIDDAADAVVVAVRAAGRAWAQREWDALNAEQAREQAESDTWVSSDNDALPLVEFPPSAEVGDLYERERELAAIANAAASEEWSSLCASAREVQL